ncbi:MAG TPA: site-2 protease family protein [Candidatus Omnitrophota bacterium]|nr:site-2 protease family protein [Candidatus Omnitrophota bacterium]
MIDDIIKILGVLFLAIVLHEYAHGWVAYKLGDPTAKIAGRLTLNPLKHIDPIGTILLPGILITMRMMGYDTFVFGWAKPVPVNFMRLRKPKRDMIWVGMAGPAINCLMAFLFAQLINLDMPLEDLQLLVLAIFINLLLAAFNMIPIPPLDGSRLVAGLLPNRLAMPYLRLERYGIFIVIVLLYFGLFEKMVIPVVNYLGNLLGVNFS